MQVHTSPCVYPGERKPVHIDLALVICKDVPEIKFIAYKSRRFVFSSLPSLSSMLATTLYRSYIHTTPASITQDWTLSSVGKPSYGSQRSHFPNSEGDGSSSGLPRNTHRTSAYYWPFRKPLHPYLRLWVPYSLCRWFLNAEVVPLDLRTSLHRDTGRVQVPRPQCRDRCIPRCRPSAAQ